MRSFVLPVLVRTAVLGAVPWVFWSLVESDPDFHWLIALVWTMAVAPAVWAGVDGVRSARRGKPARIGLAVWLLAAAAIGLLQAVLSVLRRLTSGGPLVELGLGPDVRLAVFYALIVAVPAVLAFAVTFGLARGLVSRGG